MKHFPEWVRLPVRWIEAHELEQFKWKGEGQGSAHAAALMVLTVIAHHANHDTGIAKVTYDTFCNAVGLSRSKISDGLRVLEEFGIIKRVEGRGTYQLSYFDPKANWAKFPANGLYAGERIHTFYEFRLRRPTELNALKLYFLFAARRGRDTNMANISFDKIEEYTGIDRARIKPAISFLASLPLVYVEHVPSLNSKQGVASAYRLAALDRSMHMGTIGRSLLGEGPDVYRANSPEYQEMFAERIAAASHKTS